MSCLIVPNDSFSLFLLLRIVRGHESDERFAIDGILIPSFSGVGPGVVSSFIPSSTSVGAETAETQG